MVIRYVKDRIRQGDVGGGDLIPSAKAIAERLGVDRRTVSGAFTILRREGILRPVGKGRGMVVSGANGERESRGVLRNSVVVLSPDVSQAKAEHKTAGWADEVGQGAIRQVRRSGMNALMVHPTRWLAGEDREILAEKPFGLIVPDIVDQQWMVQVVESASRRGVPLVVYGDSREFASLDRVVSDHDNGTYELVRYLISQGRRRIATMWAPDRPGYWFASRRSGYERALREAGLAVLPAVPMVSFPPGYGKAEQFKDVVRHVAGYLIEFLNGPTPADALLVASDGEIPAVAAACRLFGKIPGQDVLIGGYDNYWADVPERAFESAAPCATVEKQNNELGAEMVRLLMARVKGELPAAPQRRVVEPRLIVTGTP